MMANLYQFKNYIKPSRSGLAGVKVFMGKTYFFVDSNLYEINASGFKKSRRQNNQ